MTKVPEFVPLFCEITDKSERRIDELLTLIHQTYNPLPLIISKAAANGTTHLPTLENDVRLLAYAYLRSRNWNVMDAFKMFKASVAQRQRIGADTMKLFPSPFSIRGFDEKHLQSTCGLPARTGPDSISEAVGMLGGFFKIGYHYYDKRGLPVAYWIIDSMDPKAGLKKVKQSIPVGSNPKEYGEQFVVGFVESGWALCRYQDKLIAEGSIKGINPGASRRNFVTVVVDARGLTMKLLYRPVVDLIKDVVKDMNSWYADCIHRVLVVNCSSLIRLAFGVLKPALNEGLQFKITFISPEDTPIALDRVIGKERVPSFLGGTCNCPGGCIQSYNPNAVLTSEEDSATSDVITEDIKLSAGGKHEKAFEMEQGEDVVWEFVSTKGVDIRFSVYFYPKQAGISVDPKKKKVRIDKKVKKTTSDNPLVKSEKISDSSDHYMAPEDGILRLVWDNSSSWVQDKPIQMRAFKSAPLLEDSE